MRDLENLSIEELETIAADESVKIPESLSAELNSTLGMLSLLEELKSDNDAEELLRKHRQKRIIRIVSLAASLVLFTSVGIGVTNYLDRPKDTCSDPYEAYAQLDQAFSLISCKVGKGTDIARGAEAVLDRTNEILENMI